MWLHEPCIWNQRGRDIVKASVMVETDKVLACDPFSLDEQNTFPYGLLSLVPSREESR